MAKRGNSKKPSTAGMPMAGMARMMAEEGHTTKGREKVAGVPRGKGKKKS